MAQRRGACRFGLLSLRAKSAFACVHACVCHCKWTRAADAASRAGGTGSIALWRESSHAGRAGPGPTRCDSTRLAPTPCRPLSIVPCKVAHDSNLDMNEMGGCWRGLVPGPVPPCSGQVLRTKRPCCTASKLSRLFFRPVCLRVQLSSPHTTRRS